MTHAIKLYNYEDALLLLKTVHSITVMSPFYTVNLYNDLMKLLRHNILLAMLIYLSYYPVYKPTLRLSLRLQRLTY